MRNAEKWKTQTIAKLQSEHNTSFPLKQTKNLHLNLQLLRESFMFTLSIVQGLILRAIHRAANHFDL